MKRLLGLLVLVFGHHVASGADANGNGISDRLDLPGTQPSLALPGPDFSLATALPAATDCMSCHTTGVAASPAAPWLGSMMGNSARDPVFWAQLDVAEGDEASDANLLGARDICLRCHMAKGWTEGRSSSAPLSTALRGMAMQENDLLGVQCEVCHRLVDPNSADLVDANVLAGLNTNPDIELRVPPSYGNGMFVLDRYDVRRGPFSSAQIGWPDLVTQFVNVPADWPPPAMNLHPVKESAFHRSGNLCGTCHDVSNPAWTPLVAKGNVQLNFPIERTFTEWTHSGYPAKGKDGSCQACHMNGVLNDVLSGGVSGQADDPSEPYRHMNDVHYHDLTGGNVWVPELIRQMVQLFQSTKGSPNPGLSPTIGTSQTDRDAFLGASFAWVLKALYPAGTFARPIGVQPVPLGFDAALQTAASERAKATLKRAAELSGFRVPAGDLKVRIWNMTGHKLPTGYPEGRRMWLGVKFLSVNSTTAAETLVAESGHYESATGTLSQDFNLDNLAGPKSYDVVTYTDGAGTPLAMGRRTQVYEGRLHNTASGLEFHFIRNNERLSDDRIPPIGWVKADYLANLAEQIIPAAYAGSQMVYEDAVTGPVAVPPVIEETYNFDEVAYPVPAGSDVAEVTLWYQSVSREYIEELTNASPRTLIYPASGPSTFSRGDILEYAWRTFNFGGQTRVPPVEMAKLRIALVDTDGDGLPDNWETANGLNPALATGSDGRHGDPDADGRSNWLEFQNGTAANSADAARAPLDLILVLDFSGSMNDLAPAGSAAKVDVLKDSVDLFLKTWRQYAVQADRMGVVYFSTGATIEGGGIIDFASLPLGTTVESKIDDLITAVRAHAASGSTALGGGLQTALNMVNGGPPGRRKHVIIFTNGMQNQSPMVRKNLANNYIIQVEPVNPANGVFGDSGVTDAGGPAFGAALGGLSIPVHTIGIGVSETPDDRWQALLSELSLDTGGLNQFVSRGLELEGAFLNSLVQSLRGFTPMVVRDFFTTLGASIVTNTLEFPIDASATKATFILSWAGNTLPGRLRFDLRSPDGKPANALTRIVNGTNYQLAEAFFPLANALGRPVAHAGTWKMIVQREGRPGTQSTENRDAASLKWPADFRAYLLADVSDTSFDVKFSKPRYRAGEDIVLTATALEGLDRIRTLDKVTALVTRPTSALGTRLARARYQPAQLAQAQGANGDLLPDLAAAKAKLLLTDAAYATVLRPGQQMIELFDDGDPAHGDSLRRDGVYSARLGQSRVPGLIRAEVTAGGQTARSRVFSRRYKANALIGNAPFSRHQSRVSVSRVGSRAAGILRVTATPRDNLRNYVGPGYRDRLAITMIGAQPTSGIDDRLDGSYRQEFSVPPGGLSGQVGVSIDREPIFSGTASGAIGVHGLILVLVILALLILLWIVFWVYQQKGSSFP